MLRSVWLNELTWEDVAEYRKNKDIVLIPIGSTEQHGPAGPLGVDSYVAIALAEDAAKQADVITTPPLWFGDSPHHLAFPGTISLRSETLIAVFKDIVHSLARHGFRKFIAINGHKGTNLSPLTVASRSLMEYELPDIDIALTDPLFLFKKAATIKDTTEHHAGALEISHVWYKHPHLIQKEKLTTEETNLQDYFGEYINPDLFISSGRPSAEVLWNSRTQKKFAPTGSFSLSNTASPEKGKLYHDNMVEHLVKFIHWFSKYEAGRKVKK